MKNVEEGLPNAEVALKRLRARNHGFGAGPPDEAFWDHWNVDRAEFRFVVTKWFELLDPGSFDSWQSRMMDFSALLRELLIVLHSGNAAGRVGRYAPEIISELRVAYTRDPVLTSHFPRAKFHLSALATAHKKPLERRPLRARARLLLRIVKDHHKSLAAELLSELEKTAPSKGMLSELLSAVTTRALARGYSRRFLRRQTLLLLTKRAWPFERRLELVLKRLNRGRKPFEVALRMRWPNKEKLPKVDLQNVSVDLPKEAGTAGASVRIKVKAHDHYAAYHRAFQIAMRLGGIFNAFRPHESFNVPPEAEVFDGMRRRAIVDTEDRFSSYLFRDTWASDIERVGLAARKVSRASRDHLMSAIAAHRLAMRSTTDATRLVTLWSAIESLCRTGKSASIGDVFAHVSAASASMYAYQTLLAFWRQVHVRVGSRVPSELSEVLVDPPPRMTPRLVLHQLQMKSSDASSAFSRLLSLDPLLRFREFQLNSEMFSSPKVLADRIRLHRDSVRWQLSRIYRERNALSHRGRSSLNISELCRHAHAYFVFTLDAVTAEVCFGACRTVHGALHQRNILLEQTLFEWSLRTDQIPTAHELLIGSRQERAEDDLAM